MKKYLLSFICFICLFTCIACGGKKNAKKAYDIRKEDMRSYYVANGVKKDKVNYTNCTYVLVKKDDGNTYYFTANYSVEFTEYTNEFVDYFEWIEGTNFTTTIPQSTYEKFYNDISNKTLNGEIGELKK